MRKLTCLTLFLIFLALSCTRKDSTNEAFSIKLRLQWIPQAQFAGYIIAKEKGFYKERNLQVDILPAGPDLKPHQTVASKADDIGIGVPNQILAARSNGVPLVVIAQIFQDSANRYVLKSENRIDNLTQLKGTKVGLWLGGDEVEFVAMLETVGMTLNDVAVVPQEFTVIPFLQDEYVLSQVTVYNELNILKSQGFDGEKLQILSPKDFNSAIVGDMIFCREDYLRNNMERITQFLEASIMGWKYCLENPTEAVDIIVKANPELNKSEQQQQLSATLGLVWFGPAKENGIGFINHDDYVTAERILFNSKQIDRHVDPKSSYDLSAWNAVNKNVLKPAIE